MRVCKACNSGMETFRKALLMGQEEAAMAAYNKGSVNVTMPYSIYHGEVHVVCYVEFPYTKYAVSWSQCL